MTYNGDELHQSGWNSCSSCYDKPCEKRSRLILPCFMSDRIYVVDTLTDEKAPRIIKVRRSCLCASVYGLVQFEFHVTLLLSRITNYPQHNFGPVTCCSMLTSL